MFTRLVALLANPSHEGQAKMQMTSLKYQVPAFVNVSLMLRSVVKCQFVPHQLMLRRDKTKL